MAQRYDQFIGGTFTPSQSGEYFTLYRPSNGQPFAEVANSSQADVEYAVETAQQAFRSTPWRYDTGLRVRALRHLAALMRRHLPTLEEMESTVTGRPIREMKAQLSRLPEWYEYFASVAETLEGTVPPFGTGYVNYTIREPLGTVALLTPWNHPLLILTKKLAPALAAGNSVVIKPSELAPITVNMLAELIQQTEIPAGIVNVVHGFGAVTGKALSENPKIAKVDLTGGTPTGRAVAAAAGRNLAKVAAELGGKASVLVFDDADLHEAVSGALFAGYIATGQTCVQGARVLVHESIYDAFVELFVKRVSQLKIGDPSDLSTDIGPLISQRQRDRVLQYVKIGIDEGATLAYGGTVLEELPGWYMKPAVFTDVSSHMTIAQEEIFGPVVCIMRFSDDQQAVDMANDTEFGLAMAIWTNDIRRAHRIAGQLEAGVIWINDHHRIDPSSPWGGYKHSGIGRENGIDCYKDYTQVKNIIINVSSEKFDWFDGSLQEKRYS
ncbi:aldehyde dehydrogenase [Alicyclobacillus macrosporangiidus]|uniref:aldehyde dehydrogenase n=1 Tax=Alicyclobacillus macrosporangiidus TaxID=392015 RepID=UPI00049718ED|nr:aldehyde dehydrogenase [Alicyclobacillus macrosporangiidus]